VTIAPSMVQALVVLYKVTKYRRTKLSKAPWGSGQASWGL